MLDNENHVDERQEKRNGLCLLLPRPPNLIGRVASRHCQSPNPDPEAVTIFSKEARNLYGLSNFVKAALKKEEVDIGLVAKLIASYDLIKEVAKVRGCDIYVNESTKAEVFIDSCAKVPLIELPRDDFCYYWGRTLRGLDWLCKQISFIYAITGEGVTKGLNWLRTVVLTRVPNEAEYMVGYGYHQIQDQLKGVWKSTKYSEVLSCNLSDNTTRLGKEQGFCYKPLSC
ncbi:hypothetical protein Tco_0693596 [Tanacetum coccineum]